MPLLARFRRKKEDREVARRAWVLRADRFGEATVLDTDVDGDGNAKLSHSYTIAGADYQYF